jgi:hypothetical protein
MESRFDRSRAAALRGRACSKALIGYDLAGPHCDRRQRAGAGERPHLAIFAQSRRMSHSRDFGNDSRTEICRHSRKLYRSHDLNNCRRSRHQCARSRPGRRAAYLLLRPHRGALMALRQGATVFLHAPPFVPSAVQATLRSHEITVVQGTPSFHRVGFEFWNGTPFESVRIVTQGGEPCTPALAARIASAYPRARHVQIFGMTEAGRVSHRAISEPALASNEIARPSRTLNGRLCQSIPAPTLAGLPLEGRR